MFLGMFLAYFLNDYEIVPVAPIITGITFVFIIIIIIIIILLFIEFSSVQTVRRTAFYLTCGYSCVQSPHTFTPYCYISFSTFRHLPLIF